MVDAFNFILEFIRVDLIIGFGWYSIVYFVFKLLKYKRDFFVEFDKTACKTVVFLGILYAAVWIAATLAAYFSFTDDEERRLFILRATGPYWFGYWLQPIFWIGLTQLLRVHNIKKFLFFRILICLFFIISFERFVIMFTSFHRDYLPSSWSMYTSEFELSWWKFLLSVSIKIMEFGILVMVFKYSKRFLLNFKTTKQN